MSLQETTRFFRFCKIASKENLIRFIETSRNRIQKATATGMYISRFGHHPSTYQFKLF
jgi:hypothetical protein